MRVAMLNLTGGGLSGGYRKYLQRLVPLLRANGEIDDLLVAVPPGQERVVPEGSGVRSWPAGDGWRGFASLRRTVRAWRPDVVFIPTARWLDCGVPCVSMVRNMEPMAPRLFPGTGPLGWLRTRAMGLVARRAAVKATRVIAVSEFVADHLTRAWRIDSDRIGTVYHGVDRIASSATVDDLEQRVDRPFLLAAGSLLAYRGLEDAVGAMATGRLPEGLVLAIAGSGSAEYRHRIVAQATAAGVNDRIRWLGELTPPQLAWAYETCTAFVMTSRVEACPNTALEAMAHGALCFSTTCRPMPEFFAESAVYYPAGDAGALAEAIAAVLGGDESRRIELKQAAATRAQAFTWERTARLTIAELAKA